MNGGNSIPGHHDPKIVGREVALETLVKSLKRLEQCIRTERRLYESELKSIRASQAEERKK